MPDVLKNPRVQELLRELGEADRLLEQLGNTADLTEARDSLLRDLGRAVVQFASQHASHTLLPEDDAKGMVTHDLYTDEVPVDDDDGWYTGTAVDTGPLFGPGDLDEDETDVPESDPVGTDEDDLDEDSSLPEKEFGLETIERLQGIHGEPAPTWRHRAVSFLELLALPADPDDPNDLAVEASKVQWAVGELETRLSGMPYEVQAAFVAMLAARAQALRERLDVDVGPRLALDRLSRFRFTAELPMVAGLHPSGRAELGSWEDDVRAWWSLLDPSAT